MRELAHELLALPEPSILVVGDLILDRYVWGSVDRISPEAPIQVLAVDREEEKPGGAGSVMTNLHTLGAKVHAVGVVGADEPGEAFRSLLRQEAVDDSGILSLEERQTTRKTRMIARSQHIIRVDREDVHPIGEEVRGRLLALVKERLADVTAVCISDYGKGVFKSGLVRQISSLAREAGVPVIVDPDKRSDFSIYRGATTVTPNRAETELAAGIRPDGDERCREAGLTLIEELDLDFAVITLDREGIAVVHPDGELNRFPTRVRSVFDVTGAGDMVLSIFGFMLGAGRPLEDAVRLANVAGGLEVQRVGVCPLTRREIADEILGHERKLLSKIKSLPELERAVEEERRRGYRIVFTNGCFDILHLGHVKLLEFSRRHGDVLIVGLNTDASVRRLKGAGRPLNTERDRAQVLAALGAVDYVVLFDEETPIELVRRLVPDVLVKGEDYADKVVVGRDIVEKNGGQVVLAPLVDGLSTTSLVRKAADTVTGG